ncbi:MAG TPA: hypothetical protein VE377_09735 [Candidatus Dormibacteraeota bacterium]|nr:hypothetical protein [Candidatus Dormibacteraeota bacterium]
MKSSKPFNLLKSRFTHLPRRIFWPNELSQFLSEHRREWGASTVSIEELVKLLIQEKLVTRAEFKSNTYETIVRYVHGKHSNEELALSLQRDSFLSHGTALAIHGLAAPENTIYVNREQSPKDRSVEITQVGLKLAFKNKQRQSRYIFNHSAVQYMLLNGKHTGRAGVKRTKTTSGETVDVTNKERTLIDAVVRPAYAGGIERVADAYAAGANGIDIDHMIDLLQRLDHAYPYHQAISFLLERAGRSSTDCQKFEALGKKFDFYLDYGMKHPDFNKKWRLYYPLSLD